MDERRNTWAGTVTYWCSQKGAEGLRVLLVAWLVTRAGAGDLCMWHCKEMVACDPAKEAEDGNLVRGRGRCHPGR